ncbi:OLC1v1011433C1 [Oldenlandia corymbosa var. corymbosa]|uniref:OLC1v1011433C1 n=1 Tax=Oldenlandia corymbosa var. corymbosa TaxID=529605 RepID=A0AAV1DTL6_OLDCO|nr:OLC1v1011433C1 [Oldenlandia corymbosa var. corymbosa]
MPKLKAHSKKPSFCVDGRSFFMSIGGALLTLYALWSTAKFSWPDISISTIFSNFTSNSCDFPPQPLNLTRDPKKLTFYDDPELSYTLDKPVNYWDEKRKAWLKLHPSFAYGSEHRILLLSGSHPSPCKSPIGDHLQLRSFKNKADYGRIHGYDIFYGTACFHPKLCNTWAKVALIRAAMVAHPEAEWIWWMDPDVVITDMSFKVPLQRYKQHNLVVPGWPNLIYEKRSRVAVNTGSFLIRNCQWSMDFLDAWSNMSPRSPDYNLWSETLTSTLSDKKSPEADEQSALVYLLLREKKKWGHMIYLENQYSLHGYWVQIIGRLHGIEGKYVEVEKRVKKLRRRHAEVVSESLDEVWEENLKDAGDGRSGWRRPFITHFTGCEPCSGRHDPSYGGNSCWLGMENALNFADNQVLRRFGFVHPESRNGSLVYPTPFDFPVNDDNEEGLV